MLDAANPVVRVKTFFTREWAQLSTKFGLVLTAVSAIAPQFAKFDVRFAWAGAAAGFLLILYRGKTDGQ